MRWLLLCLLACGCTTTSTNFIGHDGSSNWFDIHCHEDVACWKRAGSECGARGYYTVREQQDDNWFEMIIECK
jgi:hypothetical protein